MSYGAYTVKIREGVSALCGQETEAGLLVVRNDESSRSVANRIVGHGSLGAKLRTLNFLALTPTHLRLFTLGGRTGVKVKEELAAWPRGSVHVEVENVVRCAYYASTGSTYDYPVHVLRITGPDVGLSIDVMAGDQADTDVLGNEQALEIVAEVRQLASGSNTPVVIRTDGSVGR